MATRTDRIGPPITTTERERKGAWVTENKKCPGESGTEWLYGCGGMRDLARTV